MAVADTMAAMHSLRPGAIGLGEFGRPGNYFERQITRWDRQYRASPSGPVPPIERLQAWLADNIPPDDGATALCHGDFRLGNLLFHPHEPRVVAILDWELSTLGHPLADLTYHLSQRLAPGGHFAQLSPESLPALGIPTQDEYVARYCERTGRSEAPELDYYLAFHLFRTAGIMFGIAGRARAGTAAGTQAAALGRIAGPLADRALGLARQLGA